MKKMRRDPLYGIHCLYRIKSLAGLLLFSLLFHTAIAQGIYEIKYRFFDHKDSQGKLELGQEYQALLFYNGTNGDNNILRVRFYDQKDGWCVVEQKIKVDFMTLGGKNYWVLRGTDPKYINQVESGKLYYPDVIMLSKKPNELYYTPDFAYSPLNTEENEYGNITSFKVLDKNDVSNDYLSYFYWKWPGNGSDNSDLSQSTLHLVLVTNSNDGTLGSGFSANHRKLRSLFHDIAKSCGMQFDLKEISGDDFTRGTVVSAVNGLQAGSNDVVIFYYSGHGFRFSDQSSVWPRMDLRSGIFENISEATSLSIDYDIYQPLVAKGARLTIVIGECCNTAVGGTPSRSDPVMMSPGQNMLSIPLVKSLFSKSGKILIATSSPNQPSWYYVSSGGYFCNSFLDDFLSDVGFTSNRSAVTWDQIFSSAITDTENKSGSDNHQQTPLEHIEIK